ncbi:hypothetical protein [Ramlibacter montanisoli]|uniref:Uncharacterized protein n=1 Tax=Ramlibacter montanisoli TaxID=2732512 RepID=A0A849K7J5_9BURK|nr:hypothetical protein [Ramlibacter montanisoli]NNU44328.1 hypothetical protein [Ramlibacter montanisoli]
MLRADDPQVHQTWLILAGGIALILSRASKAELETRFCAARQVYALVRARLEKRRLPKPEPTLLRDALHEIANLADPMTKEAGRECLARTVERMARKAGTGTPASTGPASLQSTGAPPSSHVAPSQVTQSAQAAPLPEPAPAAPPAEDHQATQIDLDLLFERSNKLRGTVAFARSTTFGQDS